ncbi:hypothetical protein LI233_16190, partial [Anaerostipes caccae]
FCVVIVGSCFIYDFQTSLTKKMFFPWGIRPKVQIYSDVKEENMTNEWDFLFRKEESSVFKG